MSIIYVASIGQTAATKKHYWFDAKARFKYTESVIVCSAALLEQVSRFLDPNANLIVIQNPFHGTGDYTRAVEDIVRQVMDIIAAHSAKQRMVDEVIVNTAGGTEKMSCIIKDAVDVIKQMFPYVTHVWGGRVGYETIYTVKPNINVDDIKAKVEAKYTKKTEEKIPEPELIILPETKTEETQEPPKTPNFCKIKKQKKQKKQKLAQDLIKRKQAEEAKKQRKEEKKRKREERRQQKHAEKMKKIELHEKYNKPKLQKQQDLFDLAKIIFTQRNEKKETFETILQALLDDDEEANKPPKDE